MLKKEITESIVVNILNDILLEESSKINRNEYNKVQFKIEELESQMVETVKELRKLEDSIPIGLKNISTNRLKNISKCLSDANNLIKQLKSKVRDHKRLTYQQQVEEKKVK